MSNIVWKKYKKKGILSETCYSVIYKVKKIDSGKYYAIEEINIDKYKKFTNNDFVKFTPDKQEKNNYIKIEDVFTENEYFYIIMELFLCNLKQYLNEREEPFYINEVQIILNKLETTFKNMINIKLSNIFISMNKIGEVNFKVINYKQNNFTKNLKIQNNNLKDLGMEIFYMLKKKYPLNENNEYSKEIIEKSFKTEEIDIKDLLDKLINPNINFTWDEYQYHSFLNLNINNSNKIENFTPKLNLLCKKHKKIIDAYCENCQTNICIECFTDSHLSHNVIPFSKIGINDKENENLKKELENLEKNINLLKEVRNNIDKLFIEIKKVKQNVNIYDKNPKKNFKKIYIDYLKNMNKYIENERNIKMIPLEFSYIKCEYGKVVKTKKACEIINCFENALKNNSEIKGEKNEEEISKKCDIYLDDKKIPFQFRYKFESEKFYKLTILVKKPLINANCLFLSCSSLKLIDCLNFNTNKVINMSRMFNFCSDLKELNLESFNTINVSNMCRMFSNCSALYQINIKNFDTSNTTDMSEMFANCKVLVNLDLSNFNTEKVTNMNRMFCDCKKLETLNISKFNTSNVTNMSNMFCNCNSLIELNLKHFDVRKVIDMKNMFEKINDRCKIEIIDGKLDKQYKNRDFE